jgi:DNA-binding NarL/FixJ family response regulator
MVALQMRRDADLNMSPQEGETTHSVQSGRRPRILLADSHVLFAEGYKSLLEPEFEVIGVVADGLHLVELTTELQPDLVILEVSMPQLSGFDAGEQIKRVRPEIKLIYLTAITNLNAAVQAFGCGASGYALKQSDIDQLRFAVRRVLNGELYVSPLLDREEIMMRLRLGTKSPVRPRITEREVQILRLLSKGKSMKEIADALAIKPGTVAFHKYKMMESLGLKTNTELINYAIRNNLLPSRFEG